jgi:hypothetical protein
VERKRLAEIRESAAEAARRAQADRVEAERKAAEDIAEVERKAAAVRAELDAEHEKRRREILAQEDQFHSIQSLREEIDELYARIDASGEEDAVAALAAWRAAKKKKEELTDLLPKGGGIRVKPQGRTVLVRRSKDV